MLNSSVLASVWISLKTAVVATIITFCLGVLAAWWMSRYQGKGKGLIDGIFTAPLVLPPTVVGFLLLLALGKNGFLGQLLDLVGIRVIFTWYATVIAATVVAFPLMYKTALAAFQQNNSNLIACARTLGASEITIFWRIILPLAKPGLIAGTLLAFARALGEFGATLMLAGSIPGKTQTIPIAIFFVAESGAMDRALWLVIILLFISLVVIMGVNYWEHQSNVDRGKRIFFPKERGYSQTAFRESKQIEEIKLEVDIQKQLPDFLLDIAFTINSQQNPLGILGASGAGKTTVLRCIAGLETPDRGIIVLNNRVLFDSAKKINLLPQERAVGLVFQDYALFPHLTVAENIAFGMSITHSTSVIKKEVTKQLQEVNLPLLHDRFPAQLSGGEQQRIALARALASNPAVTLLDEPFSALDTNLKSRLIKLLRKRLTNYPGLTLYVTHNLAEAYYLCPQLLIIDRGKAIAFNQKQNVINHPPNLKTAQITGCNNFSRAKKISSQIIAAIDWQCELQVEHPIPKNLSQIGIHAHVITFTKNESGINIFPVWLTKYSEFPNKVIAYLKLHSTINNAEDYQLEAEITLLEWQRLNKLAFPWYIHLSPPEIIMFDAKAPN
ncbi:molybdate ABC transporter permease subunit [Pleurocapsa sp. FMAR1]|uniref:molybdate ABC transporter permease subunit n=1 Tax=Pleurocapsa sp. FMAR1 TaxID=3040204 RepID=UPI0029C60CEE|nr:molybdate ABC transporter permease subunit [Pleurocapsa sp. FMAR1]